MPTPLPDMLDRAEFVSLSLCRSGAEWQANLNVEGGNSWRVCHGATPSEALAALFEPVPVFDGVEPAAIGTKLRLLRPLTAPELPGESLDDAPVSSATPPLPF